jgi:hypothetical protein
MQNSSHQSLSTAKRKSGILVDIHSIARIDAVAEHHQHSRFQSNGQPVETSQPGAEAHRTRVPAKVRDAEFPDR